MVPSLTSGCIDQILNKEDVSGAIIQILALKKIPGTGNDRYRLLISDGVTGYAYAMLGTQLNSLVTNGELEKFTIVKVDKCVCDQVQKHPDYKIISLLELTVLTPGSDVGEKIGDPVFKGTPEALNNNKVCQNVNVKKQVSGEMIVVPSLTSGCIDRILNKEDVSGAVIQILAWKKIPGTGSDRYRLLISDGVTGYAYAMLGIQLNSLVTNGELEKFTIVKVDKCECNQLQKHPNYKIISLLELTVLTPGSEVGKKIGDPINKVIPEALNNNKVYQHEKVKEQVSGEMTKLPSLTSGAINQILNGENVSGAVLQILDYKKVPGVLSYKYRFHISDGVMDWPFVMLSTQLNFLVTQKKLEKFTIIRADHCICNQIDPNQKVIVLFTLTVLIPGEKVGRKISSPAVS